MQSWPGAGQSSDAQGQWDGDFGYTAQQGQFDENQAWPQQMPDHADGFDLDAQANSNDFFEVNPHDGFLQDGNVEGQGGFHTPQDSMATRHQYQQQHDPQLESSYSNINPQLYAPHNNLDASDGLSHVPQAQGHSHPHSQPFNQQPFGFHPQSDQKHLDTPPQHFAQPHQNHVLPQHAHQQSQSPASFEAAYAQNQGYSRPPQQSPVQQGQHMFVPQQQPHQPTFAVKGHQGAQFQNAQVGYPQVSQPARTQTSHTQAQRAASFQLRPTHQSPPVNQAQPQVIQRRPSASSVHGAPAAASPEQAYNVSQPGLGQPSATEPSPKKRKRAAAKAASEAPIESPAARQDSPVDFDVGTIDHLAAPVATAEEASHIAASAARPKAAQARQPAIKGLPHLAFGGSVTLPAPKSYDKLTTMVALPSRSSKVLVPDLGRLPSEVQGHFTNHYRPSSHKSGLDERKAEARLLLEQYEKSMQALGKRRPKYTEYPHAFREQLKSDEATKSKAEKKAKKDMDESKQTRSAVRPTDPVAAAAWDAIGFTSIEPGTLINAALIGTKVQQAGDLLVALRGEMNRAKQSADQAVKDKVGEPELTKTRQESEQKREALYKAFDAILEHGHDRVLDNLGGHHKLVLSMTNTLIGCIKAADFSGKLPKAVLELFTMFNMTKKIADTTNFDTIRKRFAEKGDKDVKELVGDLNKNIKKLKATEGDSGYVGTSAANRAKAKAAASGAETATAKRARDDDVDTRTTKKVAMESGGSSLMKKLAQPKAAVAKPATSIMPGKTRPVAKPAAKPDVKAEVVNLDEAKKSKSEIRAPAPPKMGGSSIFSSLLESINAPKVEAAASREAKDPEITESPEERTKRLRKEARRKLRVSWKPDAELVQVKIFEKDAGEDEGRANNMTRDAADDHAEGMVLRQRANEEDDDDDDDIPYQPWTDPTEMDFSGLVEEVRKKNYVTRGGTIPFTTDEQRRIAEREQKELMVIYTDVDDIPTSPKSPLPETDIVMTTVEPAELPHSEGFSEIHQRWREAQQMGVEGALYTASQRLDVKHGPSKQLDSILSGLTHARSQASSPAAPQTTRSPYHLTPLAAGVDAEKLLLGWLQAEQTKTWRDSQPADNLSSTYNYSTPESQIVGAMLEAVARRLADKPYPATSPPEYLADNEERVREWWFGYNKEAGARQRKEEERQRSTPGQDWSGYTPQQQEEYAPYLALLQQMNVNTSQPSAPIPPPSIPNNELNTMLAAINQAPQPASSQQGYLNANDPSFQQAMMLAQMMQGQSQPEPAAASNAWERDQEGWDRDRDWDDRGNANKKKKSTLPPHKPANKNLIGTKPCTFWQQGKCARGDKCTFRHD